MLNGELLKFLASYWGFALAIAGSFYAGITWFGRHLSQDAKDTLTLWLWGEYDSTWSHHFCNMFDTVFGKRHLSWQCFFRSSVASVLAVVLLYVLFAEIVGVMGGRALGNLSLWQAVLFGAAINIVPDYLSLFETRWLLKRLERVRSVIGQLGVLLVDALFTGAIIWICINGFQLIRGNTVLSVIEILALFSVFSLFFYSTFLTSVWAWIYCLSTWFMRLFSRSALRKILDVENKPVAQVALVGSALIFGAALVLTPVLKTDEQRQASAFDDMLCSVFAKDACPHVARLTTDDKQALEYMAKACEGGAVEHCTDTAEVYYKGDEAKAATLWRKACEGGVANGCFILGWMYAEGRGVAQDDAKAASLYRKACDGGEAKGCLNLGVMYGKGRSVTQDNAKAVLLFRQACAGGNAAACLNLGLRYGQGRGVAQDDAKALSLYRQACEMGLVSGCAFWNQNR
jgi:hypothetical protein